MAHGQETPDTDAAALAKATQNPLAAMYSLPFQNNTTFGIEAHGRTQNVLNIRPVLPFKVGGKVNMINRIILPIISANWNMIPDQRWLIPFGGGIGKFIKLGKLPLNFNAQLYYHALKPDAWGKLQSRFQLQFIFPKR